MSTVIIFNVFYEQINDDDDERLSNWQLNVEEWTSLNFTEEHSLTRSQNINATWLGYPCLSLSHSGNPDG